MADKVLVLSVDAAYVKSAWSILYGSEELVKHGTVNSNNTEMTPYAWECIQHAIQVARERGLKRLVVAIEDQFLSMHLKKKQGKKQAGINPDTLKKLARAAARWEVLAQLAQTLEGDLVIDVEYVPASTWQNSVIGRGASFMKREDLKLASKNIVRAAFRKIVDDDTADAICLGIYVASRERYNAGIQRALAKG